MTLVQKEALINEYKGNLFEFLVAQNLAQSFTLESAFLKSLPTSFHERLAFYQDYLMQNDRELFKRLPLLAKEVAEAIKGRLKGNLKEVLVVGKLTGIHERSEWGEADIILNGESGVKKISLKLCKDNAYVNTKSAGVKSFIEKYFSRFPDSAKFQKALNDKVEKDFYKMAYALYEKAGLKFCGNFDESWIEAGMTELPGQLDEEYSEIVLKYYFEQASFLKETLLQFQAQNPVDFALSLYPILGIADPDILQVICFHSMKDHEKYLLKEISMMEIADLTEELKVLNFLGDHKEKSSFEICLSKIILQIRCKPMNKFTVPGLKINCSIKKGSL